MKVNNSYSQLPLKDQKSSAGVEREAKANTKAKNASSKETGVSSQFTTKQIREKIDQTPDVNMDRVQEMKDKISKGEFKMDSKRIVSNLLKDSIREDV